MAQTDKLALFVEDMRRGGVECLAPDINASHARFTVEDGAVRYALGALKGVGDKAMERVVAERERGGPFASLEDFAARIDPRLLNRRQLESLAEAGAFDALDPDRAAVFAGGRNDPRPCRLARTTSGRPARRRCSAGTAAAMSRRSGCRAMPNGRWPSAWRPSATPSAIYFSAHPVEAHRHLLAAYKVRTYAELGEMRVGEGERVGAAMAALVEDVRWRTSARGRRYMMASLSRQQRPVHAPPPSRTMRPQRSKRPRATAAAGC